MKVILVCSCHNQGDRAIEAFSLLFPGEPVPQVIKGKDKIFKFSQEIKNKHIEAIGKVSGKFSYYIELDDEGRILKEYDLIHGKRIG